MEVGLGQQLWQLLLQWVEEEVVVLVQAMIWLLDMLLPMVLLAAMPVLMLLLVDVDLMALLIALVLLAAMLVIVLGAQTQVGAGWVEPELDVLLDALEEVVLLYRVW